MNSILAAGVYALAVLLMLTPQAFASCDSEAAAMQMNANFSQAMLDYYLVCCAVGSVTVVLSSLLRVVLAFHCPATYSPPYSHTLAASFICLISCIGHAG